MELLPELSSYLNEPIAKFLTDNPHTAVLIADFRRSLLKERQLLIIGGLVRDILIFRIHNRYIPLRDIDLVVCGDDLDKETMLRFFHSHSSVIDIWENRFGGISILLPNPNAKIGIWHINETRSLVLQKKKRTIDELLNNVIFSMNAICVDLDTRATFESGAVTAIQNEVIDFKTKFIHDEKVQAARALWYEFKLKFHLSPLVENFVRSALSKNTADSTLAVLKEKAGDQYAAVLKYASEKYMKNGRPGHGCR